MFATGIIHLNDFIITVSSLVSSKKSLLSTPSKDDFFVVTIVERMFVSNTKLSYLREVVPMNDERFRHFYHLDARSMPSDLTNKQEHGWRLFDSGKNGNPSSLLTQKHVEELFSICANE